MQVTPSSVTCPEGSEIAHFGMGSAFAIRRSETELPSQTEHTP